MSCPARRPAFSNSTGSVRPTQRSANARCWRSISRCRRASRSAFTLFGNLVAELLGRRAGPRAVLERICRGEADLGEQGERRLEFRFRLAGEADDDVGRKRESGCAARTRATRSRYSRAVCLRFMAASMRSAPD